MNANVIGNVIVPLVIFIALAIWNAVEAGTGAVLQGVTVTWKMMLGVIVVVMIAFLITGQAQVIAYRHENAIKEYLNGQHGIWGAALAGVFAPSMSSFPFMAKLWESGKAPLEVVLAVVISARLLNFQNILFFIPFLGPQLSALSIAAGVAVVIAFIPAALIVAKLVG